MPKEWEKDAQRKKFEDHRRRVKESKAVVDTSVPRELPLQIKKEYERNRVLAKIEFGNRFLMDRLAIAMEKKTIDNDNDIQYHSLGAEERKHALVKIQEENDRLLLKIRNTDPVYKLIDWERDAEMRDQYLRNLTAHPDTFTPKFSPSKSYKRAKEFAESSPQRAGKLPSLVMSPTKPTKDRSSSIRRPSVCYDPHLSPLQGCY